ncbi:beta-phosphoglucomutase [Thermolongibacillus altinsuensis]|uniref:beta-phosphoglucomutase n=1 Tax=Thermolongibacillus altinsuensis TaxID=575256 RepID=UPI00242A2B65|nr:beta-phosphoglucomutase [Thermolongibacillus altinsuensis]GMB10125.1 beta-phosphoglucomutase [Thermolongibacillus altinsuensis]
MTKKISAFIFDLDGVITDTAEYHYLAWKQLAEELGIFFDREFNEQLKGVSRMESLERILAFGNQAERYTKEEKEALAAKKNEHYKQLIEKITPNDLLPGIAEMLEDLKKRGIKIGLASASKNAFAVIERLQIGGYFDTIVDAANIQHSKPHPEIFLTAAQQLGVPCVECVGVEDAEAGIQAIKAANMFAVGVGTKEAMKDADYIVESTADLNYESILKVFQQK